jgi:glycosyltransferase involved in cell wall biosynthesis
MHIALLTRGGTQWLGGSQYIKNIAHALHVLPGEKRKRFQLTVAVTAGTYSEDFQDLTGIVDRIVDGEAVMKPYNLGNRLRWKAKRTFGTSINPRVEEFLRREQVDFAYPCRPNKVWQTDLRFAEWIPDFQYDYYPDGSNSEEIAGRRAEWAFITENVPKIVLSSAAAERDCLRLFPAAHGKTFVLRFRVWFPAEHLRQEIAPVLREYHLPERFFLISNLFAPTKNYPIVFQALKHIQASGIFPNVVCTGNLYDYRNPHYASTTILPALHQNNVAEQVRLLGVIPRWQQIQLMRHAVAVIQPSLFEGWNTSVEEAHCLGKTIILSDIPVHREQNPAAAIFFDPNSSPSLAQVMQQAWEQLPGGSDLQRETDSLTQYRKLVEGFGETFLTLATQSMRREDN